MPTGVNLDEQGNLQHLGKVPDTSFNGMVDSWYKKQSLKFSAARQQPDRSTLGRDSRSETPETATENGN